MPEQGKPDNKRQESELRIYVYAFIQNRKKIEELGKLKSEQGEQYDSEPARKLFGPKALTKATGVPL